MRSISVALGLYKIILLGLFSLFFLLLAKQSFASTTAALLPVSDGNFTQWNPKSGSIHAAMVDETVCDGNTTFNRETSVGGRDSYDIDLSTIPNGATITQIDITPCASKNTSGGTNTTFNVFYRLDGVDSADAGAYALTTTTPVGLATTSYSGLSETKSGSTALEVGGVFTAGNRGVKLSQVSTVITYFVLPTVTTSSASSITQTTASLAAFINPNGSSTDRSYRYGTSNVSCSSLPNSTTPVNIGSGTSLVFPNNQGIASLSAATTYYYCATATNPGGTTYGTVQSFTTLPNAPTAPSNLSVTPSSSTTAILTWVDNSTDETGFKIERSLNGTTGWSQVGSNSANLTSFTSISLTPQQSYYYRVYAVNTGGNSGYSNVYGINTDTPNNPSLLTVSTDSCGGSASDKVLTWQDNAYNETSFIIERSPSIVGEDAPDYEFVASVSADVTTYTDSYGECGYRVRAVNGNGNSDWAYTFLIQ